MSPVFFISALCLGVISAAPTLDPSLDAQWVEWKTKHRKTYSAVRTVETSTGTPERTGLGGKFVVTASVLEGSSVQGRA